MIKGIQFYPNNGTYLATGRTIYAQYISDIPDLCRKYHLSSDMESSEIIASIILPQLQKQNILHKIVKNKELLKKQFLGDQAGKFITIYLDSSLDQVNTTIIGLEKLLVDASKKYKISPSPKVPRSRGHSHIFIEKPLDKLMFIYGGFKVDPRI